MSDKAQGFLQLILVVIFIAGSFAISFALKPQKRDVESGKTEERVLIVETQQISTQSYRIEFETTGNVGVRSEIGIVPQVSGRVETIDEDFFAGGAFEANEVLFQIDLRDFELEVERMEAQVAQARTAFNLEEAEKEAALEEWRLVNGDKKPPPLVARKPQIDEAWANLKAAKAQLENAKLDLERASFSFPFKGRVLNSMLEQGQYVSAGQEYGSVFDLKSLEVQASLKDKELEWLLGSADPDITIITKQGGKTGEYKGKLNRSAASLDELTRFAGVSFGFENEVVDLLPGVFATIRVKSTELDNVALLPSEAMQKEGLVWILKSDGTLESHNPEIIYSTEDTIIAQGFGDNIDIVTSRVSGATEGMKAKRAENSEQDAGQTTTTSGEAPADGP